MKRRMMLYSKYFLSLQYQTKSSFSLNDEMGSKRIVFFPIMLQKEELLRKLAKTRLGLRVLYWLCFFYMLIHLSFLCISYRIERHFQKVYLGLTILSSTPFILFHHFCFQYCQVFISRFIFLPATLIIFPSIHFMRFKHDRLLWGSRNLKFLYFWLPLFGRRVRDLPRRGCCCCWRPPWTFFCPRFLALPRAACPLLLLPLFIERAKRKMYFVN